MLLMVVTALCVTPFIVLSQITAHVWTIGGDDQMFGYFGLRMTQGAVLYVDVWDNKPPGVFWMNALGFLLSGGSYVGPMVLCALALIASHVCFFGVAASLLSLRSAAIGTVLFSLFISHPSFEGGTNRTEIYLVACELGAVWFYISGFACERWWKWLAAGLLCGCAFVFKQVGLVAWGAMGLHTIFLVITRQRDWRDGLRTCLLLLAGVVMVVLVAILGLYVGGGWRGLEEAYFAIFTFNRGYFAVRASSLQEYRGPLVLLKVHMLPVMTLPLLMGAAGGLHALLNWLHRRGRPAESHRAGRIIVPSYGLLLAIWFGVAMYGAMISPTKLRWYLLPTMPPLLLMCAYLLHHMLREADLLTRMRRRAWVAFAVVVMGYFAYPAIDYLFSEVSEIYVYRYESTHPDGWRAQRDWEVVADHLSKFAKPGDPVQAFGWMPGVYLHGRFVNACRFATTEKVTHVGKYASFVLDEIAEKLEQRVPVGVAIRHVDWRRIHGLPSSGAEADYTRVARAIDENYEVVDEIPEFETIYILERKDPPPAGE